MCHWKRGKDFIDRPFLFSGVSTAVRQFVDGVMILGLCSLVVIVTVVAIQLCLEFWRQEIAEEAPHGTDAE